MKKITPEIHRDIALAFAALGDPVRAPGFFFHCKRWRNPVMSPLFLPYTKLNPKTAKQVERFFSSHPTRYPYDAKLPYLNLLNLPSKTFKAPQGWTLQPNMFTVNMWRKPLPFRLPRGFSMATGHYFDRRLYRDFRKTMVANFSASTKFIRELDLMMRGIQNRIQTVIIYHQSGKVAGAGLVATHGGRAFLFCGSIGKAYRGRGLWRVLVAARQMVSSPMGAQFWVTTTQNPRIMGKGENSCTLHVLKRDS